MTDHRRGNPGQKPHHDDLGFEREDLGGKPVFGFIVSLVISGVLIYYVIWGIFYFLDAYDQKNQQTRNPLVKVETNTRDVRAEYIQRFPEPRLEENERTEINDFRYGEEQELNSYGWVDQKAGVAHIPIDQAMQLIAQRGLPTTPQTGTVPFSPVNLAKAAAEASDTSDMQAPAQPKGKKQ